MKPVGKAKHAEAMRLFKSKSGKFWLSIQTLGQGINAVLNPKPDTRRVLGCNHCGEVIR